MGPIRGRQVPGGPHVGLMNFAIWVEFVDQQTPYFDYVAFKLDEHVLFLLYAALHYMLSGATDEKIYQYEPMFANH